ncbi:MAG: hypothetical protein FD123_3270 [Bacteroidetes bacterium]|nr:MAG: hypothetical protein FD123_3270 [Bacteroidota bacterium]
MRLLHRLLIPLIFVLLTWYCSNIYWSSDKWKNIIYSDAKGYYAYLPSLFIYNDLNLAYFDAIEQKYYKDHSSDFRTYVHGRGHISKYWYGVALLESPFFLAAHGYAKISGADADGYSKPYAIAVNLAGIAYLCLGLVYLRKLLRSYKASDLQNSFITVCILFGTNLFYYSAVEPGMSHVYSFAAITMFMWYSRMYATVNSLRYLLYCAGLLGLIVAIRPVNALVILWVPAVCGGYREFLALLKSTFSRIRLFLPAAGVFLILACLQFVIFKLETGNWFFDSYPGENFDFTRPELLPFLFSYKKGVFVYLPILLLCLPGFYGWWKFRKFSAVVLLTLFLLIIYVSASWWCWYYGGSFGMRVMVDWMAFFAILMLFTFRLIPARSWRFVYGGAAALLMLFCQFQTLQYRYNVIHWSEMNKQKYWEVFMNTDFLKKKK